MRYGKNIMTMQKKKLGFWTSVAWSTLTSIRSYGWHVSMNGSFQMQNTCQTLYQRFAWPKYPPEQGTIDIRMMVLHKFAKSQQPIATLDLA
jgi:hypothetical protein